MKLRYDPATDMLHISFGDRAEAEGSALDERVAVHLDAARNVAALEIENASERVNLDELEAVAHPPAAPAPAS